MRLITHVNHSSIALYQDDTVLLTDPWYFVNAFHGWAPFPQPDASLVTDLLRNTNRRKIIIISHAHDDHFDSVFLGHLHRGDIIVCPRLPNTRFRDRLVDWAPAEVQVLEASEDPIRLSGYEVMCASNNTLSSQDFIFMIKTASDFIIHANDNWHRFSTHIISLINREVSGYPIVNRYIFAQVGVADSFPTFYQGYSSEEKTRLVHEKCTRMVSAIMWNARQFKIPNVYAYANQSIFECSPNESVDPYSIRDRVIADCPGISQLYPSSSIGKNGLVDRPASYTPLIKRRLGLLTNEFNEYLDHRSTASDYPGCLKVFFICKETDSGDDSYDENCIFLASGLHQWNRILCGDCNLESIVTGGCGNIIVPPAYNMHREYDFLVDWGYVIQARARRGELFI